MAYCSNCGNQLEEGAKFCSNCGTAVESGNNDQRKTSYDGEIHKCPSCGEVLPAFAAVCPACGYELRGTKANKSVQELVQKLQQIDNEKSSKGSRVLGRMLRMPDKKDDQKINLIKSFAIPNTKEDIVEFAYLAAANIDLNSYKDDKLDYKHFVSDAWFDKLEQAYQKAKLVLAGDSRLNDIQELYDSTCKSISKAKSAKWKKYLFIIGGSIAFIVILWIIVLYVL
jgi:RNA polymerase subunit RPABC4/transcription elongation factor Spt4